MRPATRSTTSSHAPIGHLVGFSTPVTYCALTRAPAIASPLRASTTRPVSVESGLLSAGASVPGDALCAYEPVNITATIITSDAAVTHKGYAGRLAVVTPRSR